MNKYGYIYSICVFISLFSVCTFYHFGQIANNVEQQKSHILNRVSLDLHWLLLKESHYDDAIDGYHITQYIDKLNQKLTHFNSRVKITSIHTSNETEVFDKNKTQLYIGNKSVVVAFSSNTNHNKLLYIVPFLLALANTALFYFLKKRHQTQSKSKKLIFNLHSKNIMLSSNKSKTYPLANKPFCFYIALIEFCEQYPEIKLNQHAQLPQELVVTANKYFLRLIELGHPVRRQPNFSNYSDKTLFEIRAALDALITDDLKFKLRVYPPRLQGRGDKLPSYSIPNIKHTDFEVVGK